jgi:hypothetical protein
LQEREPVGLAQSLDALSCELEHPGSRIQAHDVHRAARERFGHVRAGAATDVQATLTGQVAEPVERERIPREHVAPPTAIDPPHRRTAPGVVEGVERFGKIVKKGAGLLRFLRGHMATRRWMARRSSSGVTPPI